MCSTENRYKKNVKTGKLSKIRPNALKICESKDIKKFRIYERLKLMYME